jgi:hypothetical protein
VVAEDAVEFEWGRFSDRREGETREGSEDEGTHGFTGHDHGVELLYKKGLDFAVRMIGVNSASLNYISISYCFTSENRTGDGIAGEV